jgi:hypothetical protein
MKLYLLPLMLLFLVVSCLNTITGEGPVVEETRKAEAFNKISLNVSADVIISEGPVAGIRIKAQKNLMEYLVTRVDGNTLVISSKGNIVFSEPVIFEVTMPALEMVEVNGSGSVYNLSSLKSDYLDVEVNGSGNVKLNGSYSEITGGISGSGNVELVGTAGEIRFQINGSGVLNSEALTCTSAKLKINGSGEMKVNVVQKLEANINGSGSISYLGTPVVNQSVHGSGSVKGSGFAG